MRRFSMLAILLPILALGALIPFSGCNFLNRLHQIPQQVREQNDKSAVKETVFRVHPYVFIADFPVDQKMPLFRELVDLRDRVYRELELPESNRIIKVYLFKSRETYQQHMNEQYPRLPDRRAFFVAQQRGAASGDEDLMVFTYWSEEIEQDLRHELTHALLHSVLKDVPLWLDEGLAEYFEIPGDAKGVHEHHLEKLQLTDTEPGRPNLGRLETLKEVKDMSTSEYREAWAWVHFMLRGQPQARRVLLDYLHDLRKSPRPGLLRPRLARAVPDLDGTMIRHIDRLKREHPIWSAATLR